MKDFVFTLTTGRSGTKYLTKLLEWNLLDAECHHEFLDLDSFGVDTPDLSHMILFNSYGNVERVKAFWRSKLSRIAATPRQRYVETSHLLMKAGLIENLALLTDVGTVHLIALERDPYATIVSFRNRFDFLDQANRWVWYLDPEYARNLISARSLVEHGINGICLWYMLEIRARAARYKALLSGQPKIMFHRFDLEELRYAEGASRLLNALGVRVHAADVRVPAAENVGRRVVAIGPAEQTQIRRLIASAGLPASTIGQGAQAANVSMRLSA
jgi:hypothetical protein